MFWVGWIVWCWMDVLVVFVDQFFVVEVFVWCIVLVDFMYMFMEIFCKGFG